MNLKIEKIKKESSDVFSFFLKNHKKLSWKAGQFIQYHLKHPNPDDRGLNRYFTISSAPHEEDFRITTRFREYLGSSFKKSLSEMREGQVIEAEMPEGDFIVEDPDQLLVLVASGVGITPFRSILLDLDHQRISINAILLYASPSPEILFKPELEDLAKKHSGFVLHHFVSPQRISQDNIRELVPHFQKTTYYVSGPEKMVRQTVDMLEKLGVEKKNIRLDSFIGYEDL